MATTKLETPPPWWLEGGDEECPHCGQRYHIEVERRCQGCDCPVCPHCHGTLDQLCHDCRSEEHK
jgi:hypothetical protein